MSSSAARTQNKRNRKAAFHVRNAIARQRCIGYFGLFSSDDSFSFAFARSTSGSGSGFGSTEVAAAGRVRASSLASLADGVAEITGSTVPIFGAGAARRSRIFADV